MLLDGGYKIDEELSLFPVTETDRCHSSINDVLYGPRRLYRTEHSLSDAQRAKYRFTQNGFSKNTVNLQTTASTKSLLPYCSMQGRDNPEGRLLTPSWDGRATYRLWQICEGLRCVFILAMYHRVLDTVPVVEPAERQPQTSIQEETTG